ncbi:MAG: tRNA guanosine(34) transglycosylase Tgt [Patescibacteria group bacterium]|nr:tRNA guanosine(34) transglycosylase Tgt [Patescibacteria group bacterium]
MFSFSILHQDPRSRARSGVFETPHGILETPELAIVGTNAAFRGLNPDNIPSTPIRYAIANTFHLLVNGNVDKIEATGGIHEFMNYRRVLATDSGGFQVFSLGFGKTHSVNKLGGGNGTAIFPGTGRAESNDDNPVNITEEGATFTYDGKPITLTPELSIDLQHRIGADIIFAFDECTSSLNTKEYTAQSLERTHRWLDRCIAAHEAHRNRQALFPVVQGGVYRDLRERSAAFMAAKDVPGYGIGGSLGKTKEDMHAILEWTLPLLPDNRPRHLLGIGNVRDVFEGVERGIDLFDCVIPTREARHRVLYTVGGRKQVRIGRATDEIIDSRPGSPTAKAGVTWRQLALWFQAHDPRAHEYATLHNIFFFTEMMKEIRTAIAHGTFAELKKRYLTVY